MTRSFGLVDYKVQEAEYFLLEMQRFKTKFGFAAVQFCASAFVSAARSITFAMQASLKGHAKFEAWYAKRQEELRNDPLAKFFRDFRTVTQHIGINVVGGWASDSNGHFYFFTPCDDLPTVPEQDVLSACESYFISILQLVYDCYIQFAAVVDGQQYFTQENSTSLGKTVDDAENELGFPSEWTDVKRPGIEPHRWQALRKQADGCLIEPQFAHWLGKDLQRPPRLSPFSGLSDAH